MKKIFLAMITLNILSSSAFAATGLPIIQIHGESKLINLAGENGGPGYSLNGSNAICRDSSPQDGDDATYVTHNGSNGIDAYIQYDSISNLKAITLDQSPGLPGSTPGIAFGGNGCNGGRDGGSGSLYAPVAGSYGKLFLIPSNVSINLNGEFGSQIPLEQAVTSGFQLSHIVWKKTSGLKDILAPSSLVADDYYVYDSNETVSIKVIWQGGGVIPDGVKVNADLILSGASSSRPAFNFYISGVKAHYKVAYDQNDFPVVTIYKTFFDKL